MQKGKIFSKHFFENCAFYGLDTEPEPEPEPYKNSYGSTSLPEGRTLLL
jgi:hypothetical protein